MVVDTADLQRYYSSLSDEALMEINPADLVEAARKCYDKAVALRQSDLSLSKQNLRTASAIQQPSASNIDPIDVKPDWYDDAFEVYSINSRTDDTIGKEADTARDVLDAAGIPCHLEFYEDPPECIHSTATHGWRVLVPGRLNMLATSILDRDIFNDEFEALWKAHLEMLTDQELSETGPKDVFCGLYDKIERVNAAYSNELSHRGLRPIQS